MELSLEQIQGLIHGAVRSEIADGLLSLKRFSQEQEALCKDWNEQYYRRSQTTAGISLELETDSEHLSLSVVVRNGFRPGGGYAHSVVVNGVPVGHIQGNVPDAVESVTEEADFDLGKGFKRVKILFPWSADSAIRALELDDGAKFTPVSKKHKMLIFGDSITQGYDVCCPENAYAVRLAEYWNASAINKGIGGVKFNPALAALEDTQEPDLILVSYGGNDWHGGDREVFQRDSYEFLRILRQKYPKAQLLALTPVSGERKVDHAPKWYYPELVAHMKALQSQIQGLKVIDCSDFIPNEDALYHTDGVHPLDIGHGYHARGILKVLEPNKISSNNF